MEKPKSPSHSRAMSEMKRKRDRHYQIQILGQAPADLRQQISAIHALAVLQRSQQATTPKRLLGRSAAAGDPPAFGPL